MSASTRTPLCSLSFLSAADRGISISFTYATEKSLLEQPHCPEKNNNFTWFLHTIVRVQNEWGKLDKQCEASDDIWSRSVGYNKAPKNTDWGERDADATVDVWMSGVTHNGKVRNKQIWETRMAQTSKMITKRRLNWYGHTRRDEEDILRKVLRTDTPGKRKKVRRKTRWKDGCQWNIKSTGLRVGETNRTTWNGKIVSYTHWQS